MKKIPPGKNNQEPEVSVKWHHIRGAPSPAYIRLWGKLLASAKEKLASTPQNPDSEESSEV